MPKPHLLLDIDGVLCPFGYGFDPNGFVMYEFTYQKRKHKVFASEDNQERLQLLSNHFSLTWATMWEKLANSNKSFFGLENDLPVIEFAYNLSDLHQIEDDEPNAVYRLDGHRLDFGIETLKYPYIYQWAKHQQPFVWIDDQIGNDVRDWIGQSSVPALAIQTESQIGMTDGQVEEMLLFAENLK